MRRLSEPILGRDEKRQEGKMIYKFTRKELKNQRASDFKDGDSIDVSRWVIYIRYIGTKEEGIYDKPSLLSWVQDNNTGVFIGSTPGAGRPYYIDDFLER